MRRSSRYVSKLVSTARRERRDGPRRRPGRRHDHRHSLLAPPVVEHPERVVVHGSALADLTPLPATATIPWNSSFHDVRWPSATGTQAIDRAAQLLVRVVEAAQPPSVGELAERAGPAEEHDLAARLARSSARASCSGSATAAGSTPGRSCSASRTATARRRSSSSRSRACAGSPTRRGETINLAVPGAGRRRASRAGGHRALRRRHRLGRPQGAVRARRERQGASSPSATPRADGVASRSARAATRPRSTSSRSASPRSPRPSSAPTATRIAALSISGPTARLTSERIAQLAPLLIDEATQLARAARPPRPHARCRMTHEEILKGLYDNTLIGNAPEVKDLTNQGLEDGLEPESMLYDALIPSLEEVGARFERGDFFVPEMLIAARAMQGALDILRPLLAETGAQTGRHLRHGHRQGRRPRHRQEPRQHHARGRRLHRPRPRRQRRARGVHRRRSTSTSPTSSASRRSSRRRCRCSRRTSTRSRRPASATT